MTYRDRLVGWLVIMRHQLDDDGEIDFYLPSAVRDALVTEGWAEFSDLDECGNRSVHVTDAGTLVSDLAAPEWGIDPIGASSA